MKAIESAADIREDVEEQLLDLLPYVLSGAHLRRQTFYVVHNVHAYSRDVLAILVGVGLGFPGARILQSNSHENLSSAMSAWPWYEWLPAAIFILGAAVLKVYVARESVERRAHLAEECETALELENFEIEKVLAGRDPRKKITTIRNNVTDLVRHHVRARSYTFPGGRAPGTDVEAREKARKLCDSNEEKWG